MAETTIGVLGLAGLFKVTLEIWDFVDAGRDFSKHFSYLRTRLDTQRAIFLIWAERMGFDSVEGYVKELDNELVARPIRSTFSHLQRLFSDTDNLSRTYGVKVEQSISVSTAIGQIGTMFAKLGFEQDQPAFRCRYTQFVASISTRHRNEPTTEMHRGALQQQQTQASLWQVNKWAIRDEKKFENLLARVEALVQDLKNVTEHVSARKSTEDIARQMVGELNEGQLPSIELAARGTSASVLSSAASTRLEAIEARTIATTSDSLSRFTFATAQTRQQSPGPQSRDAAPVAAELNRTVDFAKLDSDNMIACARVASCPRRNLELFPDSLTRVLSDLREATAVDESKWWTIRPIDDRLDTLLGTIRGPPDTPYQGGIFHVRVNLPPEYPFRPPRAWFLTKVLHPNVELNGAICLDTLGDGWSVVTRLHMLLISIASLLDDPNWAEPVDGGHLAPFIGRRSVFEAEARRWTELYATGFIINPGDDPSGFFNTTGS